MKNKPKKKESVKADKWTNDDIAKALALTSLAISCLEERIALLEERVDNQVFSTTTY